jgi:prepilin-type N-terminal cleavage/methylation domain-containing protein
MMRRRLQRTGFTLVEVMLTTVLAAVLLLALWSLLSMYSKTFEGGHARTEQSQLARVLLEQMSTDFQNVIVAPTAELPATVPLPGVYPAEAATSSDRSPVQPTVPASALLPSSAIVPVNSAVPGAAVMPQPSAAGDTGANPLMPGGTEAVTSSLRPAGLFGTATFLQIDVFQPAMVAPQSALDQQVADQQLVDPQAPPGADELRTVIYMFEEYRDPANPAAEPTTRLIRRELTWPQAHPSRGTERDDVAAEGAFGRSEDALQSPAGASDSAEAFAAPISDLSGADDNLLLPSTTTIPEVLEFVLRYFDGAVWSEEWDSVSRRSLPTAIEVSLRLRSAEEVARPTTDDVANQAGVDLEKVAQWKHPVQRLLIPLPLAAKPAGMNRMPQAPVPGGRESFLGAETHARFDHP